MLHHIEQQHGRTRDVQWGPRTLDLDIVDSENFCLNSESLTIPHSRAHERLFVLMPLAEIDPTWVIGNVTATELCKNLEGSQSIAVMSEIEMRKVGWEVIR